MKCNTCDREMWQKGNSYFLVCTNCGTTCKVDVKNKKVVWKGGEYKVI